VAPPVGSVVRALRILQLVAEAEKPLTLTEIGHELKIPKSTAHGILRDLVEESFLAPAEPGGFVVGLKAFEVGSAHLRLTSAVGAVAPELARLTRALNITSHYAVLDGAEAVYLCKEDPPGLGVQLASSVGARLPSHLTAVGKASLAWLPLDELREHVVISRRGQRLGATTFESLTDELASVRELGYASDDGEAALGIRCVAAPVFDTSGCRGAIGVSYLRDLPDPEDRITTHVVEAAARATAALGGRVAR
jgi:DNA-binding IclR family transcriptional regulator